MRAEHRWSSGGLPNLTPVEQSGLKHFWHAYDTHYEQVREQQMVMAKKLPQLSVVIERMTPTELADDARDTRRVVQQAVLENHWEPLLAFHRRQGEFYASQGVTYLEWSELVGGLKRVLIPHLLAAHADLPEQLGASLLGLTTYSDLALGTIGDAYLSAKETIIAEQKHAIHELSTPVLRMRDRLLLLPIVGVVDTQRARLLTEQLLDAIRAHRAKVVVIDITGVPAVDSKVANHLFQTVAAAGLMGATSIVTGLSAAVAQAVVTLGVDLSRVNTVGDLQEGIEEAERLLGYTVVPTDAPRSVVSL